MAGRGPRRGLLGHRRKGPASSGHCTEADPGLYGGHGDTREAAGPNHPHSGSEAGRRGRGRKRGKRGNGEWADWYLKREKQEAARRLQEHPCAPTDIVTRAHQEQVYAKFYKF